MFSLAVMNDGGGSSLFAGGSFTSMNGVEASRIAKWDGVQWSRLGAGLSGSGTTVRALHAFDDGGGEALYVGGLFTTAGESPAASVAKWNGSQWSALGTGVGGQVNSLCDFDDGGGAALYVGGQFPSAGGVAANHIAKWDGAIWSALDGGVVGPGQERVHTVFVFDDGTGPALYIGGNFTMAGGNPVKMAGKWDGSSWSPLNAGLSDTVLAMAEFDDGNGPALYTGGEFGIAGSRVAERIAKWSGSNWRPLGSGFSDEITALAVFDDGGGSELYAGGEFLMASGAIPVARIAKWDGTGWAPLGLGFVLSSTVRVDALEVFDDGGGPALYVGGFITNAGGVPVSHVARWDGANWTAVGAGLPKRVNALLTFDDGTGSALYAAGNFFGGSFGNPGKAVARWDGVSWTAVDDGSSPGVAEAWGLAIFDDGGGDALFVSGTFGGLGGVPANNIAKWDGATWSPLGIGLSGPSVQANAMAVFDDGGGPELYVGGDFDSAGGVPSTQSIASWDGSTWSAVGGGTDRIVYALETHDDGDGPALYVAGDFTTVGILATRGVAQWDGTDWTSLGGGIKLGFGLDGTGRALAEFDDGNGSALFVGGNFRNVPDSGDSFLGKWGCSSTAPLTSDVPTISLSAGGTQVLTLDAGPACAGWFYLMLGTVTGTTPGIDFGNGLLLPLNYDPYFHITLFQPNIPSFGNFKGTLDASGRATVSLTVFAGLDPTLAGVTLHHAFLAAEVFGVSEFASNAVPVLLVP